MQIHKDTKTTEDPKLNSTCSRVLYRTARPHQKIQYWTPNPARRATFDFCNNTGGNPCYRNEQLWDKQHEHPIDRVTDDTSALAFSERTRQHQGRNRHVQECQEERYSE